MIRLTDEEIKNTHIDYVYHAWYRDDLVYIRELNKAQIKKILKKAKTKDISNTFRLALLEEVK